jgi:MoxR-like ATPase
MSTPNSDPWQPLFQGDRSPHPEALQNLPAPPPWRDFSRDFSPTEATAKSKTQRRGETFHPSTEEIEMVNAALCLRRPLLITGKPGTGKTSLAYAVAYELGLGEVLYWPITTRSTLKEGLYSYDAIGRLQDAQLNLGLNPTTSPNRNQSVDDQPRESEDSDPPVDDQPIEPEESQKIKSILENIGKYIRLGPLGTAFLPVLKNSPPRILLIDELDKSDMDLPNDLLHIFEEGEFSIPELERITDQVETVAVKTAYRDRQDFRYHTEPQATITSGRVSCNQFPFVIMTSNGERDFPPAFLRRCLRLDMQPPGFDRLKDIIATQLDESVVQEATALINHFLTQRDSQKDELATDQLLNAVYLITQEKAPEVFKKKLLRALNR